MRNEAEISITTLLAQVIKERREFFGMTQKQLAEILFMEQQTISQYEHTKRTIDFDKIDRIFTALKLEMHILIKDAEGDDVVMATARTGKERDVLIQNMNDLSYAGLCKDGEFRFKMQFDGEFHEVAFIEKKEEGYVLTLQEPLLRLEQTCQWVEEALYHLVGYAKKLTREEQIKIMNYFGEKP